MPKSMAATNSLLQVDGFGELAAAMSLATSTKKELPCLSWPPQIQRWHPCLVCLPFYGRSSSQPKFYVLVVSFYMYIGDYRHFTHLYIYWLSSQQHKLIKNMQDSSKHEKQSYLPLLGGVTWDNRRVNNNILNR